MFDVELETCELQPRTVSLQMPVAARIIFLCLILIPVLGAGLSATAQNVPGSLDATFGTGGKVTTDFGSFERGYDVAFQADGKIVVVGTAFTGGNEDIGVARYNPNGTLDATFDGDGKVITPVGGGNDYAYSVAIQPDGRIVVAGESHNGSNFDFAVVRYNPDGSLDTSFDGDGKLTTNLNNSRDTAKEVLIQPDGKIVVVGDTDAPVFGLAIVRYNPNGSLDTSFDGDGIRTVQYFSSTQVFRNAFATSAALQPDGKVVIGGYVNIPPSFDFAVVRLNSDGSVDGSFGVNYSESANNLNPGWAATPIGGEFYNDEINDVAVQSDGKIVVAGRAYRTAQPSNPGDFAVARFNANGSLDGSFGTGGKVITAIGADADEANSVVIQRNDKIIVGGISFSQATNSDFALVRYNANGSLDATFGNGGKVTTNFSVTIGQTTINGIDIINGMALQPNGRLVAAGTTSIGAPPDFALARYLTAAAPFDFDGDARADIAVFRPSNGTWYFLFSTSGTFAGLQFGANGDLITPADFDGDGRADIAVFRPSNGTWYWLNSSNNSFAAAQFGASGDLPVPGDFDGDGRADIAVFRPSTGAWYWLNSSNGQFSAAQFGANGDKPQVGDFDGNGKTDLAVFRPSNGTWYVLRSSNNAFFGVQFGVSEDIPTTADFDGDGRADIAVYRPSNGAWYRLNSSNGQFVALQFGVSEDKPVAADYDGDGKADIAVFRPSNGTWYLLRSTAGFTGLQFGISADAPTPAAFGQ